jgi:lysozyme
MNTYTDTLGNKYINGERMNEFTKKPVEPSDKCYQLLKHYEGLKLEAYLCSGNVWTIGYGQTYYADGRRVKQGDRITKEEAEAGLPIILKTYAISVHQKVRVGISQSQFDALCSFAYNVGIGAFDSSTLLQVINRERPIDEIEAQFMRWNKAGGKVVNGLTARRKSEFHLFATGEVKYFN